MGASEAYTHDNMINRWNSEKNKWLTKRPQIGGPNGEPDVRGTVTSGMLPQSEVSPTRLGIRRTMKQL